MLYSNSDSDSNSNGNTSQTHHFDIVSCIGETETNPLQVASTWAVMRFVEGDVYFMFLNGGLLNHVMRLVLRQQSVVECVVEP